MSSHGAQVRITAPPVVLVHGLWMSGWVMRLLARRIRASGRSVLVFSYQSRAAEISQHAQRLAKSAASLGSTEIHFVAHSLGGLVTLHALTELDNHCGKVVLLGSPLNGSATAERFSHWPGAGLLLGQAVTGLRQRPPLPPPNWSVHMIAGSRRIGLGVLVSRSGEAGDGTVALHETQVSWLAGHQVLPETHSSLLVSRRVADAVIDTLSASDQSS